MGKKTDAPGDEAGPLSAERARELILKRRARFMAAALAGAGVAACDGPQVCLSFAQPLPDAGRDASEDSGPGVCLTPVLDAAPSDPCEAHPDDPQCQPTVCLQPTLSCDLDPFGPGCEEDAGVAPGCQAHDAPDAGDAGMDAAHAADAGADEGGVDAGAQEGGADDAGADAALDATLDAACDAGPQVCLTI